LSTLKVTNLQKLDGSTFPVGKIGQVLQTTVTDTSSYSLSSDASADITGLSVSITPSSTSSKILITTSVTGSRSGDFPILTMFIKRDGTKIGSGVDSGNRFGATASNVIVQSDANSFTTVGNQFLDSPSTTSAVTYQIALNNNSGASRTLYVNRTEDDTDAVGTVRGISTITVMEVLA
tara:strand:- start:63 stop:596 length:534 start_codon:yes stop_codon:yes gene_type:complete